MYHKPLHSSLFGQNRQDSQLAETKPTVTTLVDKVIYRMALGLRKKKERGEGKRCINRLCTSHKNPY